MTQAFRSLADIEALERTPYEAAIPARTTYGLIARAAEKFGDRDAFVYLPDADLATPPRRVTYAQLLDNIHRAANLFRSLGAGPDDAIAILAPNIPETHYALWGAQLASRACPINYLLQPDHIAALLKASGAEVVVALGANAQLDLSETVEQVQSLADVPVLRIDVGGGDALSFQELLAPQPAELVFDPDLSPGRVAACFHTGGTTGAPKLALHTHGNEAHTSWFASRFYGFDENTVEINGFPLFHVAGAFVYGLSLLSIGATQVLPTLTGMRNAAFVRNYWRFCEREKVTALACVPTILATLVNLPVDADVRSVKVAYTGGSPLPPELAARFEEGTGIAVRNILGMTECAGLVSIEPAAAPRVAGSTGLRLPYTEVRAVRWHEGEVNPGEQCPRGETGVVVLRGPHVSPGYTDATRDAGMFRSGWLVSGDLGHIDKDGYLHITGRAKDVIIRGSHNIDPGLVEEAFLRHPAVAMCAVVGEPDAYAGELPVAFVTLRPGAQADAKDILSWCAPHVYEHPAVPKRVTIVDAMPVTAIGKIYKPALRLRAIETKLREVLAPVAGGAALEVEARDDGGKFRARVVVGTAQSEGLEGKLLSALAAIAVPVVFVFEA